MGWTLSSLVSWASDGFFLLVPRLPGRPQAMWGHRLLLLRDQRAQRFATHASWRTYRGVVFPCRAPTAVLPARGPSEPALDGLTSHAPSAPRDVMFTAHPARTRRPPEGQRGPRPGRCAPMADRPR